jgi:hypothetical protein
VNDVHDGPIKGVAEGGSQRYWFAARFDTSADEYEFPRRLYLYEMRDAEFQEESARHQRFEEIVGNLTDCFHLPPAQRLNSFGQTGHKSAEFYDDERNRREPNFETRPVVGWFDPPKRPAL